VGDQQGGNNENNMPLSLVQETLDEGASSLKSVDDGDTFPRPPSPPPHATKMKSSDVDMFLKVLKNKPKSALVSGKKSSDAQVLKKLPASSSVGKTNNRHFSKSHETPDRYEHGKPFWYWWQLSEGLSELSKLYGWIMHSMKQGIHSITASIPTWVFSTIVPL
jgi:hypothetical protein